MSSSEDRRAGGSAFTETGVRDYERRRYKGFDQRIVRAREERLVRSMLKRIVAPGASGPDGLVLDLPCGYGRFTALLRASGWDVVDADLSFEMARRAGEKLGKPGVVGDATRGLPFKTAAFAVVFSIRFFHHLREARDRAAVLSEFRRVANGWAVVSFYRASGPHRLQRRIRRWIHKSRANIKMTEPGLFEREADAAGFEVVRVAPLFRGFHAYHLALLRIRAF
jgi:SAM-dependent methyltransferase